MSRSVPRAPTRDGAVVADPPLTAAGTLMERNRKRLDRPELLLSGRRLTELQSLARREAVVAARDYLAQRGEPMPIRDGCQLIVAGHQPELFHAGVWVKNFAIHGLARQHGLTPLNLIVDNDTVKTTVLRLPTPDAPPRLASLAFDHWAGEVPYEEHRLAEPELFASFGVRACAELWRWGYEPLLTRFWPEVCRLPRAQWSLVERFPAARRQLEREWGCHNLEVPLSTVCRTEAFSWFVTHLLAELPRFHALYNACVQDYRRRHGIRSRSHPVPDLLVDGDWLETPFWGWRAGQLRRSRLFARRAVDRLDLRAGPDPWPAISVATDHGPRIADVLESAGFKLRPRALMTTLFARLLLADLFVHGIGGGKYDELTDALLHGFYGIEPPEYLILSATCHLPLPTAPGTIDDQRRLVRMARDLWWNPQRHLPPAVRRDLNDLLRLKEAWVARAEVESAGRRQRFEQIRLLTERLRPPLATQLENVRDELARVEGQLAGNAILRRRDYAFCFHPEATLRPFCEQFLSPADL